MIEKQVHPIETTGHSKYKQLDSCLCIFWKYGHWFWVQTVHVQLFLPQVVSVESLNVESNGTTLSDNTRHYKHVHVGF